MALNDRTEKRLVGPTIVTTSNATIATVPASRVWTTKQMIITNTNSLDVWVSISINTTAAATPNSIFFRLPIAGNDTLVFDTALVLVAAETIQAVSDRGNINVTLTGWEKEV